MEQKTWTKDAIVGLLQNNDKAVERAMVAIWERQTMDEQSSETTNHHNNVGFAGWSVRNGSYYAKWVLSGKRLTRHHLDKARKIAIFHATQLTKIANGEI